jgi:hypothetical protein
MKGHRERRRTATIGSMADLRGAHSTSSGAIDVAVARHAATASVRRAASMTIGALTLEKK